MDPIATPTPTAAAAPRPATGDPGGTQSMIGSDFETFLRMLTTQLENQDPLNPMKSSEFAVQLATFSGVEQQVRTNDLLEDLKARSGPGNLSQMAGLVGMEARVAAPLPFSGDALQVRAAPADEAARAEMTVLDSAGRVADRFDIPLAPGPVTWTGTRPDGSVLPSDRYSFAVTSFDADGQEIETTDAEHYAEVVEARAGPEGARLVLGTGASVPADSVSALREPAR